MTQIIDNNKFSTVKASDEIIIEAQGLKKNFDDLQAVREIDFRIMHGECFGFLGPNGAGKSSSMRMVYCFSPPSGGSLTVFGMDVTRFPRQIKARIGVVPQDDNLDPDLSVIQNLHLFATYFDIPKKKARQKADELLDFFSLREKADKKIHTLSGGMRRRLLIARALINEPEVIILDEPTTGLDPQARHMIWHRLRTLKAQGVTMVLTTHYMEEAELLCDRLLIMDHGAILAQGSPQQLIKKYVGKNVLEIRADHQHLLQIKKHFQPKQIQKMKGESGNALAESEENIGYESELVGDTLFVRLGESRIEDLAHIPELSSLNYVLRPASLEDVFLHLTGRDLRD